MSSQVIPSPEEFAAEQARVLRGYLADIEWEGADDVDDLTEMFRQVTLQDVESMISAAVKQAVSAERARIRRRAEEYLTAIGEGPFSASARTVADVALSIRLEEWEFPDDQPV